MKSSICRWTVGLRAILGGITIFIALLGVLEAAGEARTTEDVTVSEDTLRVLLRPMTKDELAVEEDAWLAILRTQITEVGEVGLKLAERTALEESGEDAGDEDPELEKLKTRLVEMRTQEVELYQRINTVVEALKAKGGDVAETEQYLAAVSDLEASGGADSRAAALVAAAKARLRSPEGGAKFLKRIGVALVIVIIFWILSRSAGRIVGRVLSRKNHFSELLINFAKRTAGGLTLVVGILVAVSTLGVQVGPLMAALGAGGFIIGFALQETLASFASGLMIMIYRPFDVADYVSVGGMEGTVQEMSLVSTTLLTLDNKVLIIPNKSVWGDTITNYTGRDLRRVDLVFGIGYGDDIPHAIAVLEEMASSHPLALKSPALTIEVLSLGDSSVNIGCRPWVKTADYWSVYWELTKDVKMRFDQEGISIPFPQRDVHLIPGEGEKAD
jgi:small conductance mechanosensitive channel